MSQVAREAAPARARGWSAARRREAIQGWLWSSPWILGFLLFTFLPMVASLYLSFTEFTLANLETNWTGLANYKRALSGADDLFWPSLGRTFEFALMVVPL